jgi:hypothetical protein
MAGITLGDAATLGEAVTLGDATPCTVSYKALSWLSADVAVAISCAVVVDTARWLNNCVNTSAAMMAASGADRDGVLDSLGKNPTVSDMCSACVVAT